MKRAPGSPTKRERRRLGRQIRRGKILKIAGQLAHVTGGVNIGWFARWEAYEREKPLPTWIWQDEYGLHSASNVEFP